MILPDKNISLKYSLLNCGKLVLENLANPTTVSGMWSSIGKYEEFTSFDKYILTLDFLYMINAIDLRNGLLVRCKDDLFSKK